MNEKSLLPELGGRLFLCGVDEYKYEYGIRGWETEEFGGEIGEGD